MTKKMLDEVMNAKQLVHKTQVDRKVSLTLQALNDQLDILRSLMMMSYPAYYGLGDWEPIKLILENKEFTESRIDLSEELHADQSTIWICGKELDKSKFLKDYFGSNEKSKYIVKIQKRGQGMPLREPVIDAETHKSMLKYYHKKSEEQKYLDEEGDSGIVSGK